MKVKTPQQKKRDSYSKDRRNAYGESAQIDEAPPRCSQSPKVRWRPTFSRASNRRLKEKRRKRWQKSADVPLRTWVEGRLQRRARLGIDDASTVKTRVRRVRTNSGR
jgi:hypothetical protein